jgi:hypothetical protein
MTTTFDVWRSTAMSTTELSATSDFYALESTLPDQDRALLAQVRGFMRDEVAPIINDYWSREGFPDQVFPRMAEIGMGGLALEGYGCANRGVLVDGFVAMEMASVDCSVATGLGVHNHLAMGSIHHCGSEEQKRAWLPRMARPGGHRRLRSDRARGRLRRRSRTADHGSPRRRYLGPQRSQTLDRERDLRRRDRHLGPRRGRQ